MKRHKTPYPGVLYQEANRIGAKGLERIYYIVFKPGGKVFEAKVGRRQGQHSGSQLHQALPHVAADETSGGGGQNLFPLPIQSMVL